MPISPVPIPLALISFAGQADVSFSLADFTKNKCNNLNINMR